MSQVAYVAGGAVSTPARLPSLPRLDPAAYHGLIGDMVSEVAPSTEADPAAVLVSLLALAGAMTGDGPHVMVGASRHPPRIWPLVMGRTGSGRKGESWAVSESVLISADPHFASERLTSGLSTGEGLIAMFTDRKDEEGNVTAIADKRLLVTEQEFARVLTAARREHNTLSTVLRGLWDHGRAGVMTKGAPIHCHGAHLVVVAHITPHELLARLSGTDVSGGLLNRFLPVLAQRPHLLPSPPAAGLESWGPQLDTVTIRARAAARRYRRDDAAEELWAGAYAAMAADEEDGPLGEVLARGPAYAMRLALLYALLDEARLIGADHLRAGLAVWAYAAASARRVFGAAHQTDVEKLSAYLADGGGGRTRTEIRDLFGRHKSGKQIDAMLAELERAGHVTQEEDRSGPGRPVVRAYWTGPAQDALSAYLNGEPCDQSDLRHMQAGGGDLCRCDQTPSHTGCPAPATGWCSCPPPASHADVAGDAHPRRGARRDHAHAGARPYTDHRPATGRAGAGS